MTYIRPISKPKKSGKRWRSPGHRAWIRKHHCIVGNCNLVPIECAHVRLGLPAGEQAGMSQKPGDEWCVPLCQLHHSEQHSVGEQTFAQLHLLDLVDAAREFFSRSPHRRKWEET